MRENDFDEFQELLLAAFNIMGKSPAAKVVDETSLALWFQALARFPLPLVRTAIGEHIQRGKFTPTPADIIELIEASAGADNRPGAEEAWALALSTMDDTKTVIWTQEAAEAFGKCRPVLMAPSGNEKAGEPKRRDPIAGRKAFIEIYERLVEANRRNRLPVVWFASPGTDQELRQKIMNHAIESGLLKLSPEDEKKRQQKKLEAKRKLLGGPAAANPEPSLAPAEQLAEIRRLLTDGIAAKQRAADEEIKGRLEEEDDFKRDLAKRVAQRAAYIAMADQAQLRRAERDNQQQDGDE